MNFVTHGTTSSRYECEVVLVDFDGESMVEVESNQSRLKDPPWAGMRSVAPIIFDDHDKGDSPERPGGMYLQGEEEEKLHGHY